MREKIQDGGERENFVHYLIEHYTWLMTQRLMTGEMKSNLHSKSFTENHTNIALIR